MIVVGGWRGVGTTTTALLLAAALAERMGEGWLVEADPTGGTLAGRIPMPAWSIGGLERLTFADPVAPVEVADVACRLGRLGVVAAPADPFRAHSCHWTHAPWRDVLDGLAGPVVVEIGRLFPGTPVWPVLERADHVLIVTSPEVSSAVSATEWVRTGGRMSPLDPGLATPARLVVVDAPSGVGFPSSALAADLGGSLAGWLPWDPPAVDLVHRGCRLDDRRLRRSALVDAVGRLAVGCLPAAVEVV